MRQIHRTFFVGLLSIGLSGADLSAQEGESAEARTTAHGVYSEGQAARGEELFWNICSECHVEDDFGGPFMQSWSGASVKSLFDEIYSTMPEDNPGGLKNEQYVDVISYMFKLNGMPMGETDLSADDLADVDVDWRASYDGGASDDSAETTSDDEDASADDDGAPDAAAGVTTAHGVFSEAQVARGEEVYLNICAECHVEDDFAGPFMQSWSGAKVKDLYEEVRSTMPEDNPGGLSTARYVDVISYMFKLNGMPTGDDEMSEADIAAIEIDWRASYDPSLRSRR